MTTDQDKQTEIEFDVQLLWEREVRESARAYAAFCSFRELGPKRTLRAAYRALTGAAGPSAEGRGYPGCWRRWVLIYRWVERAQAFDNWKDDQQALEIKELHGLRLKQLLELDRDVHYPQILAMSKKIDEFITAGLGKTTSINKENGMTHSLDRADAFDKMCQERRELEKAYFGPARSLLEPPEGAIRGKGEDKDVAMVGRFEWIPDPEVPPEPAALLTPEAPRQEKD